MRLGRTVLSDINEALRREWLVTNGLGGYASSTVLGINTRKYHGLLVAALNPPVNRWVLLTKLDEEIKIGSTNYALGANEFRDVMHPEGHRFLSNFVLNPFPTYNYAVEGVRLQKTVFMPHGRNATVVFYEVSNPLEEKLSIRVSPLLNSRHIYHITTKDRLPWRFVQKRYGKGVIIQPSVPLSALILSSGNDASFVVRTGGLREYSSGLMPPETKAASTTTFDPDTSSSLLILKVRKDFLSLQQLEKMRKKPKAYSHLLVKKWRILTCYIARS